MSRGIIPKPTDAPTSAAIALGAFAQFLYIMHAMLHAMTKRALVVMTLLCLTTVATDAQTPPRGYTIPLLDLAAQHHRQVIVDREPGQYLGHPTTVLLEDGATIITVYPKGHGRGDPVPVLRTQIQRGLLIGDQTEGPSPRLLLRDRLSAERAPIGDDTVALDSHARLALIHCWAI